MNKTSTKLILAFTLVAALLATGKLTGASAWLHLDSVTVMVKESGPWGVIIFVLLFIAGSFLQVPAMLFVLAAMLVYGSIKGLLLSYAAVVLAMTINFLVIRTIGSGALHKINHPRLQKMLQKLDSKPLTTVILLRLVLWASPALNYTLAMTKVKPKHYILGAAVGIIIPILIFAGSVHFFQEIIVSLIR